MHEQRIQKSSISQSMWKVGGITTATKTWQNIGLQRILKTGRLSKRLSRIWKDTSSISKSKK